MARYLAARVTEPKIPGAWRTCLVDGLPSVKFTCPDCGTEAPLTGTHEIADNGDVDPSVVCDCGFHEYLHLEGWED